MFLGVQMANYLKLVIASGFVSLNVYTCNWATLLHEAIYMFLSPRKSPTEAMGLIEHTDGFGGVLFCIVSIFVHRHYRLTPLMNKRSWATQFFVDTKLNFASFLSIFAFLRLSFYLTKKGERRQAGYSIAITLLFCFCHSYIKELFSNIAYKVSRKDKMAPEKRLVSPHRDYQVDLHGASGQSNQNIGRILPTDENHNPETLCSPPCAPRTNDESSLPRTPTRRATQQQLMQKSPCKKLQESYMNMQMSSPLLKLTANATREAVSKKSSHAFK